MGKIPTSVVVCVTVVILAFIGSLVFLQYHNQNTDSLTQVLNMLLNVLGAFGGTGAFIYASMANNSATKAAENTNGTLDGRIEAGVHKALATAGLVTPAVQPVVPPTEGGTNDG